MYVHIHRNTLNDIHNPVSTKGWNAVWLFADPFWQMRESKQPKDVLPHQLCLKIKAYSEFDASNTFQISWDRGNKSLWKLYDAPETPVWNIPWVNRFTGDRW